MSSSSFTSVKRKLVSTPVFRIFKRIWFLVLPRFLLIPREVARWGTFIQTSQWWDEKRLKDYQWVKVKEMLDFCYRKVPYYQKLFRDIGAKPEDFQSPEDFKRFPLLTKETVRAHAHDMVPAGTSVSDLIRYNTGGSTGLVLPIYRTRNDDLIEEAFIRDLWKRVGYKSGNSRMILRGEVLENNKLWVFEPSSNSWYFSSYHLSEQYIDMMVKKLNSIRPKFLHVYPSSLWVFANLMKKHGLQLGFTPKAILAGSEKLFDHQRSLFAEMFHCPSYTWYGLAEQSALAGECEHSTDLHIFPQHSYVELIDAEGGVITGPDQTGRVVGTNLHRFVFPLIRYITDDLAKYKHGNCACGRSYPRFGELEGRVQNMIVSRDGRIIPVLSLVLDPDVMTFSKIEAVQVHQKERGVVELRIVRGADFSAKDADELCRLLSDKTGRTVTFTVSFHERLERAHSGKHIFLVQEVPIDFYGMNHHELLPS